ncbi:hypothetical protein SDC9_111413 [bioreactor metagenome]|uniref:Uncharacterized protein n=1 Tax=bioreactor metagenome TaxID=1076179 RepID=A0A645BH74_9ZZZZ
MRTETVADSFDQYRTISCNSIFSRFFRDGINSQDVHSVYLDTRDSCTHSFLSQRLSSSLNMTWGGDCPTVVLDKEQAWCFIGSGKVDSFVEIPLRTSSVTSICDDYIFLVAFLQAQRDTCSLHVLCADDDLRRQRLQISSIFIAIHVAS